MHPLHYLPRLGQRGREKRLENLDTLHDIVKGGVDSQELRAALSAITQETGIIMAQMDLRHMLCTDFSDIHLLGIDQSTEKESAPEQCIIKTPYHPTRRIAEQSTVTRRAARWTLRNEAKMYALQQKGCPRIRQSSTSRHRPYLVMDYIEGVRGSFMSRYLQQYCSTGARLHLARRYAELIQELHIVHRDIKPDNYLIDTDGDVFISDFGIAAPKPRSNRLYRSRRRKRGTRQYRAPEAEKGKYHRNTDVYGLGMMTYELLAKQPLYGRYEREFPELIFTQRENRLHDRWDGTNWEWSLIRPMIERNPKKRASIDWAVDELRTRDEQLQKEQPTEKGVRAIFARVAQQYHAVPEKEEGSPDPQKNDRWKETLLRHLDRLYKQWRMEQAPSSSIGYSTNHAAR